MSFLRSIIRGNAKSVCSGIRVFPTVPTRSYSGFLYDEHSTGTMNEIKMKMMKTLGLERGWDPHPKSREHLLQYQPKMEDLPTRSMNDSFSFAIIPLSKSKNLQDRYVANLGHVRLGRLMEDMDLFAVWVCHSHLKIPKLDPSIPLPYTFVTVLVDKVDFTNFVPNANQDIRLSGHVCWVGKSSMEIVVWLEQLAGDKYEKITRAIFLMAARNATNTKSAPVNPLEPANERERIIYKGGKSRQIRRKQMASTTLHSVEPNEEEQKLMHNLFIRTTRTDTMELNIRILPEKARWMNETSVVSTIASFPENRNVQNTVFGGFLMRNALEISWVCASLYCGARPKLLTISDIQFQKPVNVSSFLKMYACIVYTQDNYMQILTLTDILDSSTAKQVTSNVFSYTFKAPNKVAEILPRSYDETLWYIDGKRKFIYGRKPFLVH